MKYKEHVCELLANYNTERSTESDLRKRYRDTEFEYLYLLGDEDLRSQAVKAGILKRR